MVNKPGANHKTFLNSVRLQLIHQPILSSTSFIRIVFCSLIGTIYLMTPLKKVAFTF